MMEKLEKWWIDFSGSKSPMFKVQLFVIHLNIFIYSFAYWMTQPVLPFLTKSLNADMILLGYFQTTFNFVQLLGGPLIGRLCDVKGGHVALFISQSSASLSYFIMSISWNIPLLFISQLPTLLMHSMHSSQAILTDLTTTEKRASAFGRLSLSYGLGMVIGSSFGGSISSLLGNHGVAFLSALVSFSILPINYIFLSDTRDPTVKQQSKSSSNTFDLNVILQLLKKKEVVDLIVLQFLLGLGLSIQRSSFSQVLQIHFKLDAQQIGFIISFAAIIGVTVNTFIVGWVITLFSEQFTVFISMIIMWITFLIYSMVYDFYQLILVIIPIGFCSTIAYTLFSSRMTVVTTHASGTSIGLSHATRTLCGVVSPTLGGYLLELYGFSAIGMFSAMCTMLGIVYYIINYNIKNKIT